MSRIYKIKSSDATPPSIPQGQTRQFFLNDGRNECTIIELEYHVWTVRGVPHDAYYIKGSTRTLSFFQVQDYISRGILTPVMGHTPTANALAA